MGENDRKARLNLGEIICALHDSEINGEVVWFFDREWKVRPGDPLNGYDAVEVVADISGACVD